MLLVLQNRREMKYVVSHHSVLGSSEHLAHGTCDKVCKHVLKYELYRTNNFGSCLFYSLFH